MTFINNRNMFLSFYHQAPVLKFKAKRLFIYRLQESRAKRIIDFKDCTPYQVSYLIVRHHKISVRSVRSVCDIKLQNHAKPPATRNRPSGMLYLCIMEVKKEE